MIPNRSIPTKKTVEELHIALQDKLRGKEPSSMAFLYTDINRLKPWAEKYGDMEREVVELAHYQTMVGEVSRIAREYGTPRVEIVSRHKNDKHLLYDLGSVENLFSIAASFKAALDATEIPGGEHRKPKMEEGQDGNIQLDPQHLTVRIGAVYQRQGPFDWKVLLEKTIEASRQAKHTEGQVLVVEYTP